LTPEFDWTIAVIGGPGSRAMAAACFYRRGGGGGSLRLQPPFN